MKKNSKSVRLQVFVSSYVDDRLEDLSKVMGMHKNEIVRVAISNYLLGLNDMASKIATVGFLCKAAKD